ncbi:MAG TPA: hypothetical protein VF796_05310 [Humisphaera sp.]
MPRKRRECPNIWHRCHPHARRAAELRAAMLAAVAPEDVAAIVRGLVDRARAGDTAAAKEVLDRTLGRSVQAVAVDARVGVSPDDPNGPIPTSGRAMAIRLIRIYAGMGLPRQLWGPMVEEPYKRWLRGEDAANRPVDFDALARQVRDKCDVWELRRPDDGNRSDRPSSLGSRARWRRDPRGPRSQQKDYCAFSLWIEPAARLIVSAPAESACGRRGRGYSST